MIYVALLRGINVGGNNKISMKALKKSFESVGMQSVITYINSGNIIFKNDTEAPQKLPEILEKIIQKDFALDIKVVIRSIKDYQRIMEALPENWANDQEMKSDVMFLWKEIDNESILNTLPAKPEIDTVKYVPGSLLWSIGRKNQSKSGILKLMGTKTYHLMTIRNVNTARKIWELMNSIK